MYVYVCVYMRRGSVSCINSYASYAPVLFACVYVCTAASLIAVNSCVSVCVCDVFAFPSASPAPRPLRPLHAGRAKLAHRRRRRRRYTIFRASVRNFQITMLLLLLLFRCYRRYTREPIAARNALRISYYAGRPETA